MLFLFFYISGLFDARTGLRVYTMEGIIKEEMLCVVQHWSRYTSHNSSTGVGNMEIETI